MAASVYFNDYVTICTVKINNIVSYDFLSIEIKIFELLVFDFVPKQYF